jgi:hypothetical protein
MMYKPKYIKYKKKYLNLKYQLAGNFDMDEEEYGQTSQVFLKYGQPFPKNPKYIAGPVSLIIVNDIQLNKYIYMFGDTHLSAKSFVCGPDDDTETIYFPDYLNNVLSTLDKDKYVDLFIELPYQADKTLDIPIMESGMINNIRHIVDPCFKLLIDKTECKKMYPNVRFHAMDIRYFNENVDPDERDDIKIFLAWKFSVTNLPKRDKIFQSEKPGLTNVMLDIIKIIDIDKISSNYPVLIDIFNMFDSSNRNTFGDSINLFIIGVNSFIERNTTYSIDTQLIADKILELRTLKKQLEKQLGSDFMRNIQVAPEFITFIKKYIGNEQGIYADINHREWNLINTSNKIKKNIKDSYDLIRYKYPLDVLTYNEDTKNNQKIINIIIIDILETQTYNILRDDVIMDIFRAFLRAYGAILMDVYLLGRIFKKFNTEIDKSYPAITKNIIIIAGNNHIMHYKTFFENIGSHITAYELRSDKMITHGVTPFKCVGFRPIIIR